MSFMFKNYQNMFSLLPDSQCKDLNPVYLSLVYLSLCPEFCLQLGRSSASLPLDLSAPSPVCPF